MNILCATRKSIPLKTFYPRHLSPGDIIQLLIGLEKNSMSRCFSPLAVIHCCCVNESGVEIKAEQKFLFLVSTRIGVFVEGGDCVRVVLDLS